VVGSPTIEIDGKAKAMKAAGEDVVGFGAGEPDFDTPEFIKEAAKVALDKGATKYTPAAGMLDLRKAICAKLERDNGLKYAPADIVVSNGAKHSIYNTFHAILNAGDEVVIPKPYWVSYPEIVKMAMGVPVFAESNEADGFLLSAKEIEKVITPRTKAIMINSPGNPSGAVCDPAELEAIAKLAVKYDLFLVSDEIYEKLIYDGHKHVSIASFGDDVKARTIVINGMSKAYAMTGWRIGYTASAPEIAKVMNNYQSNSTSNPNTIAQHAALAALNGPEDEMKAMVAEFKKRRDHMCQRINAIDSLSCRVPGGAFYVMLNISAVVGKTYNGQPIKGSMDFAGLLLETKKVAVVPGAPFGADKYVRLSYATSMANIDKGLDRIAEFVKELK
jgi:aspartate aminotransferase